MSDNSANNKRIAKNTLMLYIRMFLMMAITLYTSRVILEALGVEDFGIYNVVGGIVVSFSILTNALSGAATRFITFGLGKGDLEKLKDIFSTSVNIQIYLSFIIVILTEIIGVWFLNTQMNIPQERMEAANWVFQFSILTFAIKLINVPYNALIIAHERMSFYAYVSILEVVLQLGIVYLLVLTPNDKLTAYGFLTMLVSICIFIIYFIFCRIKFSECRYTVRFNPKTFKEMAGFAGWNFIGNAAGILRNNGVDIIVNLFYGVSLNAARGIATQVNTAVTKFIQNFMTAMNPQITKSYAQGDLSRTHFLIIQGSRYSYFLMLFLILPLVLEMNTVLHLWLTVVPEHTVCFSQLQLFLSLFTILSQTMITALLATGHIKKYQIIVGFCALLNFPISLLFLYFGFPAYITYVVAIIIEIGCLYARLKMSKKLLNLDTSRFFKEVVANALFTTIIACLIPICLILIIKEQSYTRLVLTILISFLSTAITIYFVGLNKKERMFINNTIIQKIHLIK